MASGTVKKTVSGFGAIDSGSSLPFPLTPKTDGFVIIVITSSNSSNVTYLYVNDSTDNLIWYRIYFPVGTTNMTATFPVKAGHTYTNALSANIDVVSYRFIPLV